VIAADQDAVSRRRLADIQHGRQRNADGRFDHCRVRRGSTHAQQDGTRLFRRADRSETLGPEQGEHGQLSECRCVRQQGRQVVHAEVAGKNLAPRGYRPFPVDAAHQRAGLPRDEPIGQLNDAGHFAQARFGRNGRLD
jgi:hypothetical protein